nr:hypothetical protein [Rossellomorea vietnamensis]
MCSQKQMQSCRNRLSGPIYDRMDILLSLQSIGERYKPTHVKESSAGIRKLVPNSLNGMGGHRDRFRVPPFLYNIQSCESHRKKRDMFI